jgi:hypothetical protein
MPEMTSLILFSGAAAIMIVFVTAILGVAVKAPKNALWHSRNR